MESIIQEASSVLNKFKINSDSKGNNLRTSKISPLKSSLKERIGCHKRSITLRDFENTLSSKIQGERNSGLQDRVQSPVNGDVSPLLPHQKK